MKRRALLIGALSVCGPLILGEASTRAGSDLADAAPGPVFSDTGPEAAIYGAAQGYRIGLRETALAGQVVNLVGTYSHFDEMFPSRRVPRASNRGSRPHRGIGHREACRPPSSRHRPPRIGRPCHPRLCPAHPISPAPVTSTSPPPA